MDSVGLHSAGVENLVDHQLLMIPIVHSNWVQFDQLVIELNSSFFK